MCVCVCVGVLFFLIAITVMTTNLSPLIDNVCIFRCMLVFIIVITISLTHNRNTSFSLKLMKATLFVNCMSCSVFSVVIYD